jgi:2-methylcitrate dehydratase
MKNESSLLSPVVGDAMGASDRMAHYASTLRFADLDAETVAAAKLRILDVFGCALGGTRATGCEALVDVAREQGGTGQAGIVGHALRVPVAMAAMVNAILARSYDYEVMGVLIEGRLIPSHHAATTVMTALALCESASLSGQDLIAAVVVGDDVAARVLAASGLDFSQGWDGSATYAAIGAAAVAGRLLGLSPLQMRHAMGITVSQIGGTIQSLWDGSTDFKLGQGAAARNAVLAAQLAARGWTGMNDPLLGANAFFAQYTAGCSDPGILERDLGQRFWAEAYFKPYPACMATHVCIEAALSARQQVNETVDAIEAITVRLPKASLGNFCAKPFEPRACAHVDAIFSYQHMVAGALLRGGVAQQHYLESEIREPRFVALARRIELEALPPGRTGAEVELLTRSGQRAVGVAAAPSRSPLVQMASEAEIDDKFRRQVEFSGLLVERQTQELREQVAHLDEQKSVTRIAQLLSP